MMEMLFRVPRIRYRSDRILSIKPKSPMKHITSSLRVPGTSRPAVGSKADIRKAKRNILLQALPGTTRSDLLHGAGSDCRPKRNGNLPPAEMTGAFIRGEMN